MWSSVADEGTESLFGRQAQKGWSSHATRGMTCARSLSSSDPWTDLGGCRQQGRSLPLRPVMVRRTALGIFAMSDAWALSSVDSER